MVLPSLCVFAGTSEPSVRSLVIRTKTYVLALFLQCDLCDTFPVVQQTV